MDWKDQEKAVAILRHIRTTAIPATVPTDFTDIHGAPYALAKVAIIPLSVLDGELIPFLTEIGT